MVGASRADPLPLEGLRERLLPECAFRGRQTAKLQYALLAAAAIHGGTEPDLLDEVAWWQTADFWQYAMHAAVAFIRAAASQAGVPVRQACQDLGERPGHPAPADYERPHDWLGSALERADQADRWRHRGSGGSVTAALQGRRARRRTSRLLVPRGEAHRQGPVG